MVLLAQLFAVSPAANSKRLRPAAPSHPARATDRLGTWTAVAIFLVALSLRLGHLWQIRATPFVTILMGDAQSYDAWAQTIAGGDLIGQQIFYQAPLYPYFLTVNPIPAVSPARKASTGASDVLALVHLLV